MGKGKSKESTALLLQELEQQHRDKLFKTKLSIEKIKELGAIIFMCEYEGKTKDEIMKLTGLSSSQIELIKTTPEFYNPLHAADSDAGITRTLLRAHKVRAVEALLDEVDKGNCKALSIYFDKVDKTDDASNSLQNVYYQLMKDLGIMTNNEKRTKQLQEAKAQDEGDGESENPKEIEEAFEDETPEEYRLRILQGLIDSGE